MDITKKNFADFLPSVKESIENCDFLAIDTELTGLMTQATEHAFDTMAERYSKQRENCSKFLIIQFGLSTFKYHSKQNKYTHKDFNFYIFPCSHIKQAPDPSFMCQTSSLQFLSSYGFDFNKLIYEGIPYLNPAQEEKVREYLLNKHKNEQEAIMSSKHDGRANGQKEVNVPSEHQLFIAEIHERVESFLSNDSESMMQLEPCSSYRRKLVYETVQQKHQTGIEMSSMMNEDNKRVITIKKSTDEEKLERLHTKQINDTNELETAVGFRKVLDFISQSKKLVIGHNMLLDLMHTMNQFYFPLPETLEEFKQMVHMTFPHLLDTKNMASSEKFRQYFESTSLFDVMKQLKGRSFDMPKVEPEDGFKGYDLDTEKQHEAGFDAFATAFCYIGLSKKLASLQSPPVEYFPTSSKILSPYVNRIFVMKHYDISSMNFSGPDPEPNRDNVFYVSFPREWKTVDLVELFLPYGNIYVNWLDSVSALVALKNKDHTVNAKSTLLNKTSRLYCVRTYSEYQKMCSIQKNENSEQKSIQHASRKDSSSVQRRVSGSGEGCAMDLIPEDDENEAEGADTSVSTSNDTNSISLKSKASSSDAPASKKRKCFHEENEAGEVTSTDPVFEEENTW